MADTSTSQAPKGRISGRTIILLTGVGLFAVFCAMNRQSTQVWPIGTAPVYLVLLLSFGLGGGLGFIARSFGVGTRRRG
jgi:hypothetical protein